MPTKRKTRTRKKPEAEVKPAPEAPASEAPASEVPAAEPLPVPFSANSVRVDAVIGEPFEVVLPTPYRVPGVRYRVGPLASGIHFDPATRRLYGRPGALARGTHDLTYSARVNGRTEVATVWLHVSEPPADG